MCREINQPVRNEKNKNQQPPFLRDKDAATWSNAWSPRFDHRYPTPTKAKHPWDSGKYTRRESHSM